MSSITILHTSDLHNHLGDTAADFLRGGKQSSRDVLLLDAGDAIRAGNLGCTRAGEPILRRMSEIGYDAMAMGNRESHPTLRVLERKLADAAFPVLAANMMAKRLPLPEQVKSHIIRKSSDGLRIAVMGLAPQVTSPQSWWARVTDYVWDDPFKTAAGLSRKLRPDVDLLICLSHLGVKHDEKLAEIEHIDLILGGHSHVAMYPPRRIGHCYLAHAGHHGRFVGRLEVNVEAGAVTSVRGEMLPLPE
ncbi:MAG: metallophosphoesterase [Armatimonadota bacterium]|nr:MAG: metallophosphoesterase [Armatimonadota bacterium]